MEITEQKENILRYKRNKKNVSRLQVMELVKLTYRTQLNDIYIKLMQIKHMKIESLKSIILIEDFELDD